MSEFFKQLIAQLSTIWQKLSIQQKVITTALVAFAIFGLVGLLLFSRGTSPVSGYATLYSELELSEASAITEKLEESNIKYELKNDGQTVVVEKKELYNARMVLAREGLPKSRGLGYELFDKTNLATTDFVQKINARRALEGELQRTIEGLDEVKNARVHLALPEPTIFLDEKEDPKASVVLRLNPGGEIGAEQVRGITHLVSSSVEGLKASNISVVDYAGRLLSSPFGDNETAMISSRNLELQHKVEAYLERNAEHMLTGVLGPNKSRVKVNVDLDFDRIERNVELYNPETRVVRSEERTDENTRNAPTGDHVKERSLTNYEIDKTIEHIVTEVGNVKRLTVSVAVDGKYVKSTEGAEEYVARTPTELQQLETIVKNAIGYDLARGDQVAVSNIRFDNEYLRRQREEMLRMEQFERYIRIVKYVVAFILGLMFIFFLRYLAKTIAEAMNPPVPKVELLGVPEAVPAEIPEDMQKSSEILERVEMLTREQPINIASIVRQWLRETPSSQKSAN